MSESESTNESVPEFSMHLQASEGGSRLHLLEAERSESLIELQFSVTELAVPLFINGVARGCLSVETARHLRDELSSWLERAEVLAGSEGEDDAEGEGAPDSLSFAGNPESR